MGIKDLNKLLKKECGDDIITTINVSELSGLTIAIDISVFLYKFIKSVGKPRWIDSMISMMMTFKKNKIRPICIFDGPNPPYEKKKEQVKRRETFSKIKDKLDRISEITREYIDMDNSNECVPEELKQEIKELLSRTKINENRDMVDYTNTSQILSLLQEKEQKLMIQTESITQEDMNLVREFLDIVGLPYSTSDGEAETLCAWLCIHGQVDAVLSEDTDVMVYGTPTFLCKYNARDQTLGMVKFNNILQGLEMTHEQFIDLCILCRCDYNKHNGPATILNEKTCKEMNIGTVRGLNLIKKWESFEQIELNCQVNLDALIWERCRELFRVPNSIEYLHLPYSKPFKKEELPDYLLKIGTLITQSSIEEIWDPVPFIFPENENNLELNKNNVTNDECVKQE